MTKGDELYKNIKKYFESLRYQKDLWTVYSDFLELIAISISNACEHITYPERFEKREKRYLDIVKNYSKDELLLFSKIFQRLVNAMLDCEFNPQKQLFVECNDLDSRACLMAYIQLATLGIPAIVRKQNTLTNQIFDTWITPAFYIDGRIGKLKGFKDKEKGESLAKSKEIIEKREEILDKKTERPQKEEETIDEEDEQLSLF